jgi:cation diffusion facilitator CzcD-associated flavoprotein CzcO
MKHNDIIIIGAGFAGIGAGIKLQQAGLDFLILEKAAEVGGVWRENTYPGCACDIPSALYSYSFSPNPNWSQFFAAQPEIKQYTLDTVEKFKLKSHINLHHELLSSHWDGNRSLWQLETNQGSFTAKFVIMACGPMHQPVIPAIEGIDSFTGESFHSAKWNHKINLAGKKIAVIGSGASAIQFLPAIQPEVEQLTLFQRTPPWVLPKLDKAIPEKWQQRFSRWPFVQRILRKILFFQFEILNSGLKRKGFIRRLQSSAIANIHRSISDSQLRQQLIPDYDIGCKRILQSNTWYRALAKDNVTVNAGVVSITGNIINDSHGNSCQADVIIFATGFEVANPPIAEIIYDKNGLSLAQQWQGSPQVYMGTMAKNTPNCFLTFGPNLYTFTSAFVIIESQLNYIVGAIKKAKKENVASICVNEEICNVFNTKLQAALQETVWNSGGCTSYFLDKNGRNSTNWPWTTGKLTKDLKEFNFANFSIQYAD